RERHSFGPCRGAGFLGMGVLVGGVAAGAAGVVGFTAGTTIAAWTAGAGLAVAIPMYLLGLLLLPGAAGAVTTRLRRLLDGAGSGVCLMFAAWLLLIDPSPGLRALPLAVVLATCMAVAVAAVTGLRAARYRPAALACAGGASLGIAGLATLAVGFEAGTGAAWLGVAGAALVAGAVLGGARGRRAEP